MNKEEAIHLANEYLSRQNSRQPVSIDATAILDESPMELKNYWCFRSIYEALDPRRGDGHFIASENPYFLIDKETSMITYISHSKYESLQKENELS